MKARVVFATLILLLAGLFWQCPPSFCAVVTSLSDSPGDDYGPGTYSYPTDGVFASGSFDITGFEVDVQGSRVEFTIDVVAELDDPWGSGAGFSIQSIDIYIDTDGVEGSGATWTLDGRHARVSPVNAWEMALWCAPPFDGFQSQVIYPDGSTDTSDVRTEVDQSQGRITLSVPKSTIGTPISAWRYIVLMLGQNGYELGRIRPVRQLSDQWRFGGGTDGDSDSNIIDMVTVSGLSQEGMLANYDPATSQVCVLFAEPDSVAPAIVHSPVTATEANLPIFLPATVVDSVVVEVRVHYRQAGQTQFNVRNFARNGIGTWSGEIPGEEVQEGTMEYFLFAHDGLLSSTLPADTLFPFAVTVGPDVSLPVISQVSADPLTFYPDGDGFRDSTAISWHLSEPCFTSVEVEDSLGQAVRTLADSLFFDSGPSGVWWNGRDDVGQLADDGTYTVIIGATDLAGKSAVPGSTVTVLNSSPPPRQIDAVFLFHFNQNLVPYSKVASTACYVGLLETLRAHPSLKFMIHLSGCLLHSLLWLDSRAVDLTLAGVADGQFEIVGSTYGQNIMYSTRVDSTDFQFNDEQIKTHRELITKIFGVSPVSFWNPERTWTQNFVQLIADNGYENVQVEDHILFDSGISGSEYLVRTTSYNGRTVNVFDDDKSFEGTVNYAIDSGDYQAVINFLHDRYNEDANDEFAVCYHEDAEATGLWDYEGGEHPSVDWSNLDALLTALESDTLINVTTYSEFIDTHGTSSSVGNIVDGAAVWMGGADWFDENASPTGDAYRQFFDEIRDTVNAVRQELASATVDTTSASRLLEHAWFNIVAYQYEFLVHGQATHDGYVDWEMARAAYAAARAAREAILAQPREYVEDLNQDGVNEVVVVSNSEMLVFSTRGGKLLYWFDLIEGVEELGGENFMYYNELFADEAHYVSRLAGGTDVYTWLAGNGIFPEVFDWQFEVRRRAFEDSILVDGSYAGDIREALFSPVTIPGGVYFSYDSPDFTLSKSYSLSGSTLDVYYSFFNKQSYSRLFSLHSETAFCPSCLEAMDSGVTSLKYWTGNDTTSYVAPGVIGVTNTVTNHSLRYDFTSAPTALYGQEVLFGLELTPEFAATIPGLTQGNFSFSVTKSVGSIDVGEESPPAPTGLLLRGCSPNPFAGSLAVTFVVGGRSGLPSSDAASPGSDESGQGGGLRNGSSQRGRGVASSGPAGGVYALENWNEPGRGVSLRVFDVTSRFVRTLFEGELPPGVYAVNWDGRNEKGRRVPSGVYLLHLEGDGESSTTKVVRIR
jgi:flagellar hook assembly protein FlgD